MVNNSYLRNVVITKPDFTVNSIPKSEGTREKLVVETKKINSTEDSLAKANAEYNEFAEFRDIYSELYPNNPSLYKVFVDEYIPKFFQLSANNQSMLKDEFRILLEDMIPVKKYDLHEHDYIAIENALFKSIKSHNYSRDFDLNSEKLILARLKSETLLPGIDKYPILSVYLVKNALDSSLNLANLINKDQKELIKQEDSISDENKLSLNKYTQLKNNVELDLILRNISDFIKNLDTVTVIPDEYNQHDISSFIRNQNSINTTLSNLLFYFPRDNEAFIQTINGRKKQVQVLLNSDKLDFSAKELLLNRDLFPELELSFDRELDFDKGKFAKEPLAYLKKYFNTIEDYMKIDSIDTQRRIYDTLKSLYAESHLILDKNTRFRFFSAIVNVTPLAANEIIDKADINNENYRFFQTLNINILDDLITSEDQNDLMTSKNFISFFSNSPDKLLQKKVLDLASKLVAVDANSSESMKSSIKKFFEGLLQQDIEPDLKTNLTMLAKQLA